MRALGFEVSNIIAMVTSLVGGVSSASDHLGDGGVLAEELLLPVSQVLLCLVISEVEISISAPRDEMLSSWVKSIGSPPSLFPGLERRLH